MKANKKTIPALGLLLLSGAIAFPHLSDAMQLGVDLNTKVNVEKREDREKDSDRVNEEVQLNANVNTDKAEKDKNNDWKENGEHDNRNNENRRNPFKAFGNWWKSMTPWDKDKTKDDNNDTELLIVTTLKVTASEDDAVIDWSTNYEANATVEYATSSNFANSITLNVDEDDDHSVTLQNLESDTTYYYKITVDSDEDEQSAIVKTGTFTTDDDDSSSTDEGPKLLWIRSSFVTDNSATIAWITPERSTSKIWIESDSDVNNSVDATHIDSTLSYFHTIKIEDLDANTTYYYKVASTDKDGNTTISTTQSFTTKVE